MNTIELTDREEEALALLGTGLTHAQVAEQMHVSPRTVKAYADTMRRKFGVKTARELIPIAHERGTK